MEKIKHIITGEYFDVPQRDYDKLCVIFDDFGSRGVDACIKQIIYQQEIFQRGYSDDEIKSIFNEFAELTGLDVELQKDGVSGFEQRMAVRKELNDYIKNENKPISIDTAKELLKILDAFESYDFKNVY